MIYTRCTRCKRVRTSRRGGDHVRSRQYRKSAGELNVVVAALGSPDNERMREPPGQQAEGPKPLDRAYLVVPD